MFVTAMLVKIYLICLGKSPFIRTRFRFLCPRSGKTR